MRLLPVFLIFLISFTSISRAEQISTEDQIEQVLEEQIEDEIAQQVIYADSIVNKIQSKSQNTEDGEGDSEGNNLSDEDRVMILREYIKEIEENEAADDQRESTLPEKLKFAKRMVDSTILEEISNEIDENIILPLSFSGDQKDSDSYDKLIKRESARLEMKEMLIHERAKLASLNTPNPNLLNTVTSLPAHEEPVDLDDFEDLVLIAQPPSTSIETPIQPESKLEQAGNDEQKPEQELKNQDDNSTQTILEILQKDLEINTINMNNELSTENNEMMNQIEGITPDANSTDTPTPSPTPTKELQNVEEESFEESASKTQSEEDHQQQQQQPQIEPEVNIETTKKEDEESMKPIIIEDHEKPDRSISREFAFSCIIVLIIILLIFSSHFDMVQFFSSLTSPRQDSNHHRYKQADEFYKKHSTSNDDESCERLIS